MQIEGVQICVNARFRDRDRLLFAYHCRLVSVRVAMHSYRVTSYWKGLTVFCHV